ncbi:D-alanine--D-alanine ligase [Candidatus Erwinia haradaeae]|uniref:D-alanine--D-alanine ligase n=1 Tax=Candidatus Erwinia haradaeae TaxID=1922217 RepID=A0A451D8L8_9GAMM|nr:D-alanine--D-alanine ligase [Candidatus Erwinia haradaeae]VFP82044.1 D-alanine--D-alanine ligase B [Candidatus Erwinia haradaeae]
MAKKIAVLLGGTSSERQISLLSGAAVLQGLKDAGINAYPIDVCNFPLMKLKKKGFIKAFIALHGRGGEDGIIQGVLEYLKLPYTGSGIMASSIAMDKVRSKYIWQGLGLPVPPFVLLTQDQMNSPWDKEVIVKLDQLGFPLFVKPNQEGSSLGSSRVNHKSELNKSLIHAFHYDNEVLIERFLVGEEYTVSIIGMDLLPSIRIKSRGQYYDYHSKYTSNQTQYFCPSGLSMQKEDELYALSIKAWNAIGCTGSGRVDIIMDDKEKFYLLEINSSPGMTSHSLLPLAAKQAGINFPSLVSRILSLAN